MRCSGSCPRCNGSCAGQVAWLITSSFSCEHGGNRVPARYRRLFGGLQRVLQTHRGYDLGALRMARELSAAFDAPIVASKVTRLLVDLNRSIGHPRLHGDSVRHAPREERDRIVAEHYLPYRAHVESLVAEGDRARPARDPRCLAQLYARTERQGSHRRRRFAL